MLEIYQMEVTRCRWDIFPMATNPEKKAAAEQRAKAIAARLLAIRDEKMPDLSNNEWCKQAGLNSSTFTNMMGGKKPASEPSVGNLRALLQVIGLTLPEFFADEARGRLVAPPTKQALELAFAGALRDLPKSADKRPEYLASTVLGALGIPANRPAKRQKSVG